jgi:hypothetical protein
LGCDGANAPSPRAAATSQRLAGASPAAAQGPSVVAQRSSAAARCLEQVERLRSLPPAVASLDEEQRAHLLARSKAEPVLFLRTPRAADERSREAIDLDRQLRERGYRGLAALQTATRRRPSLAREVLLREHYFYFEEPELAALLVEVVELRHLFDDERIVLERGARRHELVRNAEAEYVYADGPESGQRAHLLLFDRVWASGGEPGPALHRDARALAERLGFEQLAVERQAGDELLVHLHYGVAVVAAVVSSQSPSLELTCEVVTAEMRSWLDEARSVAARRRAVHARVRSAVVAMVNEGLPFDEPKTEDGQQDGKLRLEWRTAYRSGRNWYEFNADRYWVFDSQGRPRVPQVCIDFVTDAIERASGTWWAARGAVPTRIRGRLDFSDLGVQNERSVEAFVGFASAHPEWFDVRSVPHAERVPFRRRREFFRQLFRDREHYQPGDIVMILGLRDDDKLHYHSFIVFDSDPVTSMPTLVASNAGKPRVRSWEHELRNAPKRSILTRVRPRLDWLESVVLDPVRPPTAAAGPPGHLPPG